MKFLKPFLVFLIVNFAALGIGSWLMKDGPKTEWYISLNQAPWTPPGWVFGVAWTTIMICFSIYIAVLYLEKPLQPLLTLFGIQLILNVSWNYIFFNQHLISFALVSIFALTFIVMVFMVKYWTFMKIKNVFIIPYFIWLCIATSLNLYILLNN